MRGCSGVDTKKFDECLNEGKGSKHAPAIRQNIARMQQLGVGGTPLVLIGLTPPPGSPMKVVSFVYGAQPYPEFKSALDDALAAGEIAAVYSVRNRRLPGRNGVDVICPSKPHPIVRESRCRSPGSCRRASADTAG